MHEPYLKAMAALLRRSQPRHDLYTVFGHCMEAMALAMANSVDLRQREPREARYLDIVGHYRPDVIGLFPRVLAELVQALEVGPGDVLGALFHELELHNKARGQFFTSYTLSRFMAQVTIGDSESVKAIIRDHGFVTAMEPACGAGSMVIALAEAMRDLGINYQRHLHVTAIDIDPRAIHMAYVQSRCCMCRRISWSETPFRAKRASIGTHRPIFWADGTPGSPIDDVTSPPVRRLSMLSKRRLRQSRSTTQFHRHASPEHRRRPCRNS